MVVVVGAVGQTSFDGQSIWIVSLFYMVNLGGGEPPLGWLPPSHDIAILP